MSIKKQCSVLIAITLATSVTVAGQVNPHLVPYAIRESGPKWAKTLDSLTDEGWQYLDINPQGETAFFVTSRSLVRDEVKTVTAWIRYEFRFQRHDVNGKTFRSQESRVRFDCVRPTAHVIQVTDFGQNNLKEPEGSGTSDSENDWHVFLRGGIMDELAHWSCAHAPNPKAAGGKS